MGIAILAALAAAWVTLLVLAPWLPPPPAALVYLLGGRLCHQIAERSFHLDGAQLPVCARCLGIYVGAAVGLTIGLPRLPRLARGARRDPAYERRDSYSGTRRALGSVRTVMGLALAFNGLTLVAEWIGVWSAPNSVRAAAGSVFGGAVALAIGTVDYERWRWPRRIMSAPPESHI